MEKRDGRTNLARQKKKWFIRRGKRHNGSLGKLLLWGKENLPVGYIQFGPISEYGTLRLYYQDTLPIPKGGWCIVCVAVQSPYRGQGLATRLVRNVLRDIKSRGVKTVDAYPPSGTNSWNQVSQGPTNLWERCGFKMVTKICPAKGDPIPNNDEGVLLMRKKW